MENEREVRGEKGRGRYTSVGRGRDKSGWKNRKQVCEVDILGAWEGGEKGKGEVGTLLIMNYNSKTTHPYMGMYT